MLPFLLLLLLQQAPCQQQTSLTQPEFLQTRPITISADYLSNYSFLEVNATFISNFQSEPLVYLSLINMQTFQPNSTSSLQQQIQSITTAAFVLNISMNMEVDNSSYPFTEIEVMYLALDYFSYPYIQLYNLQLQVPAALQNQFLLVDYLPITNQTSLSFNDTYQLQSMISGFDNLTIIGDTPSLYIDMLQYSNDTYLVNINRNQVEVATLRMLRVLINRSLMMNLTFNYTDLQCITGTIVHRADPLAIQNNTHPNFLPFAMLYGIKGWLGFSFDLPALTYLFNNSDPRVQVQIGYVLFQAIKCPSNKLYVASENLCYGLSAAFYYQLTPSTMAACPTTCHSCTGPLSTNCKSCVDGWNRRLSGGRCICITGFFEVGQPACKNCTEAIQGCSTCSDANTCTTCLPECTTLGFSPIYCDCPSHVQTNFSYNCPQNYYYDHDSSKCECMPQTYYDFQTNKCFPCDLGCYICVGSPSYCLVCIDSYKLVEQKCIFYFSSSVLMGLQTDFNSPAARCLRWDGTTCVQLCDLYYVGFNCFGGCPDGTFNISFPWLTCQPCKISCNLCYNYTVCFQCKEHYFYFNRSTLACNSCSQFCKICDNDTYCTQCEDNYNLANGSCSSTATLPANCPPNCHYCLLGSQCLACIDTYYLNNTDFLCYHCSQSQGFQIDLSNQCLQICGDGIVVEAQCDDGNTLSGDGCSSTCTVEDHFSCYLIDSQSYCWNIGNSLNWQIFNCFGKNSLLIEISSNYDLTHTVIDLTCSFQWKSLRKEGGATHSFQIEYLQPTLLPASLQNQPTSSHLKGVNSINRCNIQINKHLNFTAVVNTVPQSLFVDYSGGLQASFFQNWVKDLGGMAVIAVVVVATLGIVPTSSYVSLKINALLFFSFLDYYQMPINSFSVLQILQQLVFMPQSTTTKNLVLYSNQQYFSLLWRVSCLYLVLLIMHVVILRLLSKFFTKISWKLMQKVGQHIQDNRIATFHFFSTAYQLLIWTYLFNSLLNAEQMDFRVIIFLVIQSIIILVTKIHFFRNIDTLATKSGYMGHSLITDQLQNLFLALLLVISNAYISFSPLTIIFFSVYIIASVLMSNSQTIIPQFKITQTIAAVQLVASLVLLSVIQSMKCYNMWRTSSGETYEQESISIGLAINFISLALILLNSAATTVAVIIRICQIKFEGKPEQDEEATVENVSAEHWSVTS